jgi:hypothetical protein
VLEDGEKDTLHWISRRKLEHSWIRRMKIATNQNNRKTCGKRKDDEK